MRVFFALVFAITCACSPAPKPTVGEPATAAESKPNVKTEAQPPPPASKATPEPNAEVVAEAEGFYAAGVEFFREGRYDEAEAQLKQALNLYPFMASANLVLGKVLLIRGAAAHDEVLIDSARLMFKMALSIDPNMREATVLLGLFERH